MLRGRGVKQLNSKNTCSIDQNTGQAYYSYIINLNTYLLGDNQYIGSWKLFIEAFNMLLDENGAKCEKIRRVDFRIDSYEYAFSELYQLNNAAANVIAMTYKLPPPWESSATGSKHNINVRSFDKKIGFEIYDRIKKSRKNGLAKTRFEFRNLRVDLPDITFIMGFALNWIGTLFCLAGLIKKKCLSNIYTDMQNNMNVKLLKTFK